MPTLYTLLDSDAYGEHLLELECTDPGLVAVQRDIRLAGHRTRRKHLQPIILCVLREFILFLRLTARSAVSTHGS